MSRTGEHVDAFNQAVSNGDWQTFSGRFAWSSGATGTMQLTWDPEGKVQQLTVTFD